MGVRLEAENILHGMGFHIGETVLKDGTMTYQHTIEERFLDMRVLRYGSKLVRRARKIHTRFAYGHYESIASRLMYGLTDDVVAEIKQQLTD